MKWLLKIVDGPMRGAEIALAEGLRLKVGSGDDCDIVIADGSLPEVAFELDVASEAVTFIRGDETKTLVPYEIVPVETTSVVVGPADAPWASLHQAPAEKPAAVEPEPEPSAAAGEEPPVAENPLKEAPAEQPSSEKPAKEEKSVVITHPVLRIVFLSFLLLLSFLLGLWVRWDAITARAPWLESFRSAVVESVGSACGWAHDKVIPPPPAVVPGPTLRDIAGAYGLGLEWVNGKPVLRGNMALRTERMAVRSLALAEDPRVTFDLTDDETLRASAEELLFVLSANDLSVVAASNRVVTLCGHISSVAALEKVVRALSADVKGLERLETRGIAVGGTPPPKPGTPVFETKVPEKKAARAKGTVTAPAADYPIAGILTVPYPCVVLNNGLRLVEGGQVGSAVIEKIEAERLLLRDGATKFEWKP